MQICYLADFPEHIPQLTDWLHHEWGYLNPQRSIQQVEQQFYNHLNYTNLPITFIALDETNVAGTATLTLYDMDTHPDIPFWLSAVYVAPTYRKQGVGKKIVNWCTEKAKRLGIDHLHLATPDKHPWYAKMGWQAKEQTIYHGYKVNLMSLQLNDQANPFLDPKYNPFSLPSFTPQAEPSILMPGMSVQNDPFAELFHFMEQSQKKGNIII
jgi:N-acetylglutamate synthase-like GNAT family acetyltransferase